MGSHSCQEPDFGQCLPMSLSQLSSLRTRTDTHMLTSGEAALRACIGTLPSVTPFPNKQSPPRRGFENRWAGSCSTLGLRPSKGD